MFAVLEDYGFGEGTMQWIRLLYTNTSARVLVNGFTSGRFPVSKGTRQGCPLSAVLFALVAEPLIRYLDRTLQDSGLYCGHILFRVAMYADDLLIFLKDPSIDLPLVTETLATYGRMSGYQINWNKTVLLVTENTPDVCNLQLPIIVSDQSFKYLGVTVSWRCDDWYDLNVTPLLLYLETKLLAWHNLPLSLAGRISVIKMVILPKLLYVFENVPVLIPQTFFTKCRTTILHFLWHGRIPRIAHTTLTKTYEDGGMALPDLYRYYIAAQLKHAQKWLAPTHPEPQVEAEKRWPEGMEAGKMLCMPTLKVAKLAGPVAVGITLWRRVIKWKMQTNPYSPFIPIWHLGGDAAGHSRGRYKDWEERDLAVVQDLFEDGFLRDSKDVIDQAGGGVLNIMKWLEITSRMRECWPSCPSEPEDMPLLTHMLTTLPEAHQTSRLYRQLGQLRAPTIDQARIRWESALDDVIEDSTWYNACMLTRNVSLNMRHRLIHYKFLHQAYITPRKIRNMMDGQDTKCAGCGALNVDFCHVAWGCFRIQTFWCRVAVILTEICGCEIENTLPTIMLNAMPQMQPTMLKWVNLAVTLAKRRVAFTWMQGRTPAVKKWLHDLTFCADSEDTALQQMKGKTKAKDMWGAFRNYLFLQSGDDDVSD